MRWEPPDSRLMLRVCGEDKAGVARLLHVPVAMKQLQPLLPHIHAADGGALPRNLHRAEHHAPRAAK